MVKFDLINNINEREIIMSEERLDVLDKVKELVTLDCYMTRNQVAEYYNVGESAIRQLENRHSNEIESDGFKLYKRSEIEEKFLNVQSVRLEKLAKVTNIYDLNNNLLTSVNNRGLVLYTKRAVLRIGMLLKSSPVAEEVRTLLLDNHEQLNNIHSKLENNEEITKEDIDKSNPLYFVNREKELRQQELEIAERLTRSIINGDMTSYMSINCEMNKIKEDLIALEKEKNELNKPKITYYDMVLKSEGLISITLIAKDYGMSGQSFNKLLHDLGVQYKQGKQWLLYSKYDKLGWTQSETYCNSDKSFMHTKWTQKGRLGLYELLKSKNILPTIEKEQQII